MLLSSRYCPNCTNHPLAAVDSPSKPSSSAIASPYSPPTALYSPLQPTANSHWAPPKTEPNPPARISPGNDCRAIPNRHQARG
ncbi:hypothetical protein TrVFT333_006704 [Trichoderma virens FT-333]|nr:hypothetical protein TrVFT333_006704 [Trichoderma virens FT-333]